jgi:hypothetical protein
LHYILALPRDKPGVYHDLAGDMTTMSGLLAEYRRGVTTATDGSLLAKFSSDWASYADKTAAFHRLALEGKIQEAGKRRWQSSILRQTPTMTP